LKIWTLYGNFKQSIVCGVETREIEPTKGADYSKHTALKLSRCLVMQPLSSDGVLYHTPTQRLYVLLHRLPFCDEESGSKTGTEMYIATTQKLQSTRIATT